MRNLDADKSYEDHMKMEAEIGVKLSQAKECQGLSTTTRNYKRQKEILPQSVQREGVLSHTMTFASRIWTEYISVVLSHRVAVLCYGSLRKLYTLSDFL